MNPEAKCRSCGGTAFRAWYLVSEGQGVVVLGWDEAAKTFEIDLDGVTRTGDAGENDEYWCLGCEDSAGTLEELCGLPVARKLSDKDALDHLNLLLSATPWPGASGMEDVAEIVRATGRVEVPDAPPWPRH